MAKVGEGHTSEPSLSWLRRFPQAVLWSLLCALVFILAPAALASPPDLTNGETRTDNGDSNLGPTGMRGWIYQESADTTSSRQILVTEVLPLLSFVLVTILPAQTCREEVRDASGRIVQTIEHQKQAGGTERAVIRDASGRDPT